MSVCLLMPMLLCLSKMTLQNKLVKKMSGQMIYKWLFGVCCIFLAASIPLMTFAASNSDFGNSHITPYRDPVGPQNKRYAVGFMSFEVWTNGSGQWITKKPGDPVSGADGLNHRYTFSFPGRTVKDVQAIIFTPGDTKHIEYFDNSRQGNFSILNQYFATVNSVGVPTNVDKKPSSVSFDLSINGKLSSPDVYNIVTQEHKPGDFSPQLEAYRYYFPILFEFTLGGQLEISYFTETGQNLSALEPQTFKYTQIPMEVGQSYPGVPPTSAKYEYVGYRKSTTGQDPAGAITKSPLETFTYDGSYDTYKLHVFYKPKEGTGEPGTGGGGGGQCTEPTPSGQVREVPLTSPDPSAVIKADSRGSERFNVLDGIPTTESLYGNVFAKSYLHKNKFVQYSGKCSFEVEVSREYTLKWDPGKKELGPDGKTEVTVPDPQEETETVTQTHTIERPYSFWIVENLEVYRINEAKLWNYAFEGGGITISPSGYSPPAFSKSETHGYTPPSPPASVVAPPSTVSGGKDRPNVPNEDFKSYAEKEVDPVKVKNDSLAFNGSTIMSGTEVSASGPSPASIPLAPQIGNNVLYSPGNVIPMSKTNKANQPSTGTIAYTLMSGGVGGGTDASYSIHGMNSVTVHTPVVIYAGVSDDAEHNQRTIPSVGRSAIILERPFTVRMPNSGQHQNYLGYGYNNYLKYIRSKQIRFPFDVYAGSSQQQFIPKNTWIEVEKAKEAFEFYLPVWVDEGFYVVEVRTIAHNAPSGASAQSKANLNVQHHIAEDHVPVEVIGRMYDFRVTDIADYNWEKVFRQSAGSALSTGISYWVGPNGIDGIPRGIEQRYTLPIAPGSHPLYRNVAVKTGYHFKFELKTKGNMFGLQDKIRITPSFYFVDGKSGKRQAVDLYYHAGNNRFVKIGSSADLLQRYVILNDRLRNVPLQELTDTALYKYDHDFSFTQIAGISRARYVENYIQKFTKQKTQVGSLSLLELNERIRTLIGPKNGIPAGVDPARANAAIQKWYGEYSLPASVYAVPKGMIPAEYGRTHQGLTERSPIFLKEGYIVVNFNLETIQEGNHSQPHLQYIHAALMNQWTQMEGFQGATHDPYGRTFVVMDGDVLFYEADQSSDDDFRSMVIH